VPPSTGQLRLRYCIFILLTWVCVHWLPLSKHQNCPRPQLPSSVTLPARLSCPLGAMHLRSPLQVR
jgi:hypothetical protein